MFGGLVARGAECWPMGRGVVDRMTTSLTGVLDNDGQPSGVR